VLFQWFQYGLCRVNVGGGVVCGVTVRTLSAAECYRLDGKRAFWLRFSHATPCVVAAISGLEWLKRIVAVRRGAFVRCSRESLS
jgi:hypothetical protein